MQQVIRLARETIRNSQNGPFAAMVVKGEQPIAHGVNTVVKDRDPTAHAEINAIRKACAVLGTHDLAGCELYSSCEPCAMCLSAIYWSHLDRVWYGSSAAEAAAAGFDDQFIYRQIPLPIADRQLTMTQLLATEAGVVFEDWIAKTDRKLY